MLTLLLTVATLAASAYDFEVGGLRYDKTVEGEVCLVSVAPEGDADIVVPASIVVDGVDYAVTAIDGFDFDSVVLHVPTGCRERYAATGEWQLFQNIVEFDPNEVDIHAITAVSLPADALRRGVSGQVVVGPDGSRRPQLQRGLNIVRSAGGTVSKVLLK